MRIDFNSDLGESYGPWKMGDDEAILQVVTSANVACGGHASDPETMFRTLEFARDRGVVVGAHPGFADREGFGRRLIPMNPGEIERLVATQTGALMGAAALARVPVRYIKAHGALANHCADDRAAASAVARAAKAFGPDMAVLAISGTELELAAREAGVPVYSEIFADRGYLSTGRLVPRSRPDAMIQDPQEAADRLASYLETGLMPVVDGAPIRLDAHSICVHGDGPSAIAMAVHIRKTLAARGVILKSFLDSPAS